MWEREEEFRTGLQKAAKKASKDVIDTIADIAVRDDKVAYKAVCALVLHEMKALKPHYRLKLLYVMSAILRQSKSRRGERDKYEARFAPLLPAISDLLAPLAADQLTSVVKVLDQWWRDEIFEPAAVAALQSRFKGLLAAARQGSGQAGSSGGGGPGSAPPRATASVTAPRPLPQHSSPRQMLSSMSPGSLSAGGALAAAAASSLAQPPPAVRTLSQWSKAAGVAAAAPAAAGDSLSSRPVAAAGAVAPLHTVGSSSHLSEAYDPLAALDGQQAAAAAGLPPPPLPPAAGLPPAPPMAAPWQQSTAAPAAAAQLQAAPPPPSAAGLPSAAVASALEALAASGVLPPLPPAPPAAGGPAPPLPSLPAANGAPPPPPQPLPEDAEGLADSGRKRKSRWG